MPAQKLKEFLDRYHVRYVSIGHSPAYTAQEVAASAHVPGKEMAKTVMVKLDGKVAWVTGAGSGVGRAKCAINGTSKPAASRRF